MADITMCKGTGCPMKDNCYRHTAKACEFRQSYFMVVPLTYMREDEVTCEHFWNNSGYDYIIDDRNKPCK